MAVGRVLRFTILARDGFECVYCHATDKPLEVDHVRPVALGGTDDPENLVTACDDCNGGKSHTSLANLHEVARPRLDWDGRIAIANEQKSLRGEAARYRRRLREAEETIAELRAQLAQEALI